MFTATYAKRIAAVFALFAALVALLLGSGCSSNPAQSAQPPLNGSSLEAGNFTVHIDNLQYVDELKPENFDQATGMAIYLPSRDNTQYCVVNCTVENTSNGTLYIDNNKGDVVSGTLAINGGEAQDVTPYFVNRNKYSLSKNLTLGIPKGESADLYLVVVVDNDEANTPAEGKLSLNVADANGDTVSLEGTVTD